MAFQFEFDPQKSDRNRDKHGIDFSEAQRLWDGAFAEGAIGIVNGEMRYITIGRIKADYWTAIVSFRLGRRRIISVYRSSKYQIDVYERSREKK